MSNQITTEAEAPPPETSAIRPGDTAALVSQRVSELQEGYVRIGRPGSDGRPTPASRAALARLRRGLGKPLGAIPELLEYVVVPGDWPARGDEPTAKETAIYTALTLYALHQQSQPYPMHIPGRGFGTALGGLRYAEGQENPGVVRRFQALGTASSLDELVQHARGLITLLRSADLRVKRGFDYGRFAHDLERFQSPAQADSVRLSWGRDFYRVTHTAAPSDTIKEQS